MPLPTLTWILVSETIIKATTPTYADFLNAVETKVNASTHWKVNKKTLDAGNSRGYVELAPKSVLAGVTEGRILLMYSTGTVAGAPGSERPLKACRQPPWGDQDTSLGCTMWAGFSPDANSGVGGPTNDPWTNATPYGASPQWSGLFPLNAGLPSANSTLGIIESAEGIALYWVRAGTEIQGIIAGRLLETLDGNTGHWMMVGLSAQDDTTSDGGAWSAYPTADYYPPLTHVMRQHSSGYPYRSWAIGFKGGVLYGLGRNWEAMQGPAAPPVLNGYSGSDGALLQALILAGGPYTAGTSDAFQGLMRQVRWGPSAYRGQKLFSSGVEQAIHLNYANAGTGGKPAGLWFDHFRS